MTAPISSSVDDGVLVISIDRPEARNAMNLDMARAVAAQVDRLDEDCDLRVGVIHGRGGVFSAGMDLKAFRATGQRPVDERRGGGGLVWRPPAKPVIAAVEGHALGLGFEMALACDLVVAADDARFALPEVTHGLVAAGGGMLRLPARIPRAAAMEILLTGRAVSAPRLHALGLVNRVTRPGGALDGAVDLAREIAALPADAVRLTKQIADASRAWAESEMFALQEPRIADLIAARQRDMA